MRSFSVFTLLVVACSACQPKDASVRTLDGQTIYRANCQMCHSTRMMGAPAIGDKKAWEPRIAQGKEVLVDHAIHGIRSMPPKGGRGWLSDAEVKAAVEYMISHSK